MYKNDLLEQIRSATGLSDCYAFCKAAYQFLSDLQPDKRLEELVWFFQMKHEHPDYRNDDVQLSEELSNQLNDYSYKFSDLIQGLIDFFSVNGYSEKKFYQELWNNLELLLADATLEEKGFCLFSIFTNARIPYYELPVGLQLLDNKFLEIVDIIKPSIRQLEFAMELTRGRKRAELTSRVVHLLENLDNFEHKSVLLVCFWNRCYKLWDERRAKETGNKNGDSAKQNSSGSSGSDKSKNTSFLPRNIQNNGDIDIIANYQYPTIKDNEYAFALVRKGEDIFLSDQGKTLQQLDKIFELHEPDVTKNLVAILRQYGAEKQGDEFVIRIDNWNGNEKESENEDIKKAILSLFSCVSFMLNMKIFYV